MENRLLYLKSARKSNNPGRDGQGCQVVISPEAPADSEVGRCYETVQGTWVHRGSPIVVEVLVPIVIEVFVELVEVLVFGVEAVEHVFHRE